MKTPTSSDKWSRLIRGFSVGADWDNSQSKVSTNPFGEHSMNYMVLWAVQRFPSQLCVLFIFSLSEASWAVWPSLWISGLSVSWSIQSLNGLVSSLCLEDSGWYLLVLFPSLGSTKVFSLTLRTALEQFLIFLAFVVL